jgi:transposase
VGAHAALYSMKSGKTRTALADWARSLLAKKPFKVVAVALANKGSEQDLLPNTR